MFNFLFHVKRPAIHTCRSTSSADCIFCFSYKKPLYAHQQYDVYTRAFIRALPPCFVKQFLVSPLIPTEFIVESFRAAYTYGVLPSLTDSQCCVRDFSRAYSNPTERIHHMYLLLYHTLILEENASELYSRSLEEIYVR